MMRNIKQEQGFVLVVALVFLIALTGVASALLLNTTSDMKMSGASQEKVLAMQEAVGTVDQSILNGRAGNMFQSTVLPEAGMAIAVAAENTTATMTRENYPGYVECPHLDPSIADDTEGTDCNVLRITVVKNYGNNESSNVTLNTAIAQQLNAN